ncbi:MAG: M23 family metallopeptidase [Rhizobiaceae bacterium]
MNSRIAIFSLCTFLFAPLSFASGDETPKFSLPLDCTGDTRCFLQNLMDMDLSPRTRDPLCSGATYNGHKGTDIRVRDIPTMQKGVPVLAMANGVVLRIRDGVDDKLVRTKAERIKLSGIECGNGMVIDHGKFGDSRWTSQICHMAKGSLRVKRGSKIKRGQIIGMIGLSGATQFPHVHVSLRANGKLRDLLTDAAPTKKPTNKCNKQISNQLLTPEALTELQQMNSPILSSGFSDSPMNGKTIMQGKV